jgi:hypothetical protein
MALVKSTNLNLAYVKDKLNNFNEECFINKLSSYAQSQCHGAYSTRLLRAEYTGPMVNIRRGSDNATLDFYGDVSGNLTTLPQNAGTSLLTWLGAATGFVTKMYDQSGWARNIVQYTNNSFQPTIAVNSVGRFDITYDGTTHFLYSEYGIRSHPPTKLTGDTTAISGAAYENGTYIASASSSYGGGWEAWKAFDEFQSTGWHTSESSSSTMYNTSTGQYVGTTTTIAGNTVYSGEWLQIQLPNAIYLSSFTIVPRAGNETARSPRSFVVLGSNNGSTWSLVDEETNINTWSATTVPKHFVVSMPPTSSFNYYRIVIRRVGNNDTSAGLQASVQIMNWNLESRGVPFANDSAFLQFPDAALTSNSSLTATASASTTLDGGYEPFQAFDRDAATFWHNSSSSYNATTGQYAGALSTTANAIAYSGEWLQVRLPFATILRYFTIAPRSGNESTRSPRSFVVLGSIDGSTWNLVHEETNINDWGAATKTFAVLRAANSFIYYRIVIRRVGNSDSGSGQSSIQIASWDLYANKGTQASSYVVDFKPSSVTNVQVLMDQSANVAYNYSSNGLYLSSGIFRYYTQNNDAQLNYIASNVSKRIVSSNKRGTMTLCDNGTFYTSTLTTPSVQSMGSQAFIVGKQPGTGLYVYGGTINEIITFSCDLKNEDTIAYYQPSSRKLGKLHTLPKIQIINAPKDTNPIPINGTLRVALDGQHLAATTNNTTISSWNRVTATNSPTYYSSGGIRPESPYVNFNGADSEHLNAGSTVLNVNSNGGFTAVCLVQFTGSVGNYDRIFDFGNGQATDNIILARYAGTSNILFTYLNGGSGDDVISSTNPITQEEWAIFSCRYNASTRLVEIYKNGRLVVSKTSASAINDRTISNGYIARSNWSGDTYPNINIGGLYMYDSYLTDTQMGSISNHLIMSTFTSIPYNVSNYTKNIVARVGSVQSLDNRQGNCMYFPGSYDSYLDIQDMPAPPFSISFWFKTGSSADQRIGGLTNSTREGGPTYILLNSGTSLLIGQSTSYTSTITCALNTWHHVAIVYAANNVFTCYVNGSLIPGTSTVTAHDISFAPQRIPRLILGANPNTGDGGASFNGYLYNIRVYDYLLNSVDAGRLGTGNSEIDATNQLVLKDSSQYLVNKTNWYSKMFVTQVVGSYTPQQTLADPVVQLQLASSGVLTTSNHVTYSERIQDYSSFVFSFEFLTTNANADAVWFYAGATTPSNMEIYTQSGTNIGFGVWPSTAGRGVNVFTGDTARATTRIQDWRNNNTWTKVMITYNRSTVGTWTVNVSGIDVLTYSDPNLASYLSSSGAYWGLAARTGGQSMDAYVRCLELSYVPYANSLSTLIPQNTTMSLPNRMYNNSIVQSGLVAYFDPSNVACYPGVGNAMASLVGTVTGTLTGSYNNTEVAGTIRLVNTNSDWTQNTSILQVSSITNITTVSMWFYLISLPAAGRFLLDMRNGGAGGFIYQGGPGSNWDTGTLYKNGGSAQSIGSAQYETTGAWQNITVIADTSATDDITLFGASNNTEGMNVYFGPIFIYNRSITQAENLQNYNAIKDTLGCPFNAKASAFYDSSADPLSYNAGKAFDKTLSTFWHGIDSAYNTSTGVYTGSATTTAGGITYSGEWIQTRLNSATRLKSYTITPRQSIDYARTSPRSFVLLGSNDETTWTLIDDRTSVTNWYYSPKTFDIARTPVAFVYFRLVTREVGNLTSGGTAQRTVILSGWELNALSNTISENAGTKYPIGPLNSEYPSVALSSTSESLSSQTYGNGLYIISASSNHGSSGFSPFRAFDKAWGENCWHSDNTGKYNTSTGAYTGSESTTVDGSAYAGEWLQIQLPTLIKLSAYRLQQRQGYNQLAQTWKVVGSNDGTNWRTLDTRTNVTDIGVQSDGRDFTVNSTTAYSIYRIIGNVAQNTAGAFVVGEWRLFAVTEIPGKELGCGEYIATASTSFSPSENQFKIFDQSIASGNWTNASQLYNPNYTGAVTTTVSGVSYSGEWVQLQLPNQIILTSYFLYHANDRRPVDFVVAGSNNGTTWTLLDSETGANVSSGQAFSTSNLGKYSYFRLIVTKNALTGGDFLSITEWSLYDSSISMSAIAGKSKGLVDGLTWKFEDGYMNDTPSYFDTNGYAKIGRTSDLTSLTTATNGYYTSAQTIDTYSLEFVGYFRPSESGIHTFYTISDDCSFVWLGTTALSGYTTANALVNNGGARAAQMRSGNTAYLVAGTYYPIRIQFGESSGGQSMKMYFKTPNGTTIENGYGYFFSSIGTNSAYPAESARVIKDLTNTNADGIYYINCNGNSEPTYCLMNDKYDGGGWMMMMKATRGTTFQYTANYWTTANTLNATDLTRSDADAKYNAFNYVPVKDVMAIFPDASSSSYTNIYGNNGGSLDLEDGWSWKVNNWNGNSKTTALAGFQSSRDAFPANPNYFNGYGASVFAVYSYTPAAQRHCFGGGSHVFGYLPPFNTGRWAILANNENDFQTNDGVSGIGLSGGSGSNIHSAGNIANGLNRSMRVEVYGR